MITAWITFSNTLRYAATPITHTLRVARLYRLRQLILCRRDTGLRLPVLIRRISFVSLIGLSLPSYCLRGFLDRIFNCYSLLLCQKADQYFHDLFDIHMHLSNLYALLIVPVSSIFLDSSQAKSFLSDILRVTLLEEVLDRYSEVVGEDLELVSFWIAPARLPI